MRIRKWILAAMVLVAAMGGLAGATALPQPGTAPHSTLNTPAGASAPASLMQFRSQGHVLGFAPDRMYTVGMGYALIEEFVGAHPVQPQATAQSADAKDIQPLQSVTYPHLWDGITVSYTTSPTGLAMSTYMVEPKADPLLIRLRYNTDVAIKPDGSLRVQHPTAKGYFTLSAPHAWQELGGRKVPVQVAFTRSEERVVGFTVGSYDPTVPLLIDPTYAWHTFHGSTGDDYGYGIAVDGSGNVYVAGLSSATWGTPLNPHSGDRDIVVLKFDSAGALQWHTFYGSASYDEGQGIAVDGSGNVYVTGFSGDTWGTPLQPHSGYDNSVVIKLDSTGALQWHTFYGSPDFGEYGSGNIGLGIAVDGSGNVYVTGFSYTTWSGPGGELPLHAHSGIYNLVVLKLTSAGVYQWHTFYGSTYTPNAVEGRGIAVDGSGNVYVTGESWFTWSGPGGEPPLHAHSGVWNLVVLKLTSAGAYQWHTFYEADGRGIAVNGSGDVYVTGFSFATWGTPLHPYSGDRDIVVLKLTSAGAYQWHTFYGSAGSDEGRGIAVDGSGNVYVTGESWVTWDTPLNPFSGAAGFNDLVALKLDGAGTYQWHTFYGSESFDYGSGIAVDSSGNAYATGMGWGPWGTPLNPHSGVTTGNPDIAVLKLSGDADTTPDPFTFTDVTGVPLSTQQASNSITVAGIAAPVSISVSGDASSEYAINGGVWTSAPGTVNNGDSVQVRHNSASAYNTAVHTTLTIGGVSDTFTVTTTGTFVLGVTSISGDLAVVGTTATVIDMSSLATVTGSLDVSGNTSATAINMVSLTTVGGNLNVSGNTSVGGLDLSGLTSAGSVDISGNTSTSTINMSGLTTVSGDLTVASNGSAAVVMSSGTDVAGNLSIETTGTGAFPMGGGAVAGDLTLDATGYTDMSGTTPAGALDLTAMNLYALMHVQIPAESFATPVTFSITSLDPITLVPESGLDANGSTATIAPIAAYQFTFAIPTLNSAAALSFDINFAQLDADTQTVLLDAITAGTATMVTKGDAVGSVYQAFPICGGVDVPTVDGCVKVEALDALGLPTTGTPAIVRFSNVVGHFSTWTVATVTTTYSLIVTTDGTGTGTVTSNPIGITCPGDCTETYAADTVVTLTATPNTGSTFTGWGGACTGTGACTVTMDAAKAATATFSLTLPNISITLVPDSTSVPRGGSLGYTVTGTNNTTTSQTFQYWTYVTLPNESRYPSSGELYGPVTVTLSAGQTVSAHLTHGIPTNAPLGTYVYYGNVGIYPATLWDAKSFMFDITAIAAATSSGKHERWELLENGLRK